MGTNATDRLSIGRMKVDECVRESFADAKISGTSVVPYVHWNKYDCEKDLRSSGSKKERVLTENAIRFWTNHSSSSRFRGV